MEILLLEQVLIHSMGWTLPLPPDTSESSHHLRNWLPIVGSQTAAKPFVEDHDSTFDLHDNFAIFSGLLSLVRDLIHEEVSIDILRDHLVKK
jgi:hypothetical protein